MKLMIDEFWHYFWFNIFHARFSSHYILSHGESCTVQWSEYWNEKLMKFMDTTMLLWYFQLLCLQFCLLIPLQTADSDFPQCIIFIFVTVIFFTQKKKSKIPLRWLQLNYYMWTTCGPQGLQPKMQNKVKQRSHCHLKPAQNPNLIFQMNVAWPISWNFYSTV